jgi:hypothetical protein
MNQQRYPVGTTFSLYGSRSCNHFLHGASNTVIERLFITVPPKQLYFLLLPVLGDLQVILSTSPPPEPLPAPPESGARIFNNPEW